MVSVGWSVGAFALAAYAACAALLLTLPSGLFNSRSRVSTRLPELASWSLTRCLESVRRLTEPDWAAGPKRMSGFAALGADKKTLFHQSC
jgi:hypothetical protein